MKFKIFAVFLLLFVSSDAERMEMPQENVTKAMETLAKLLPQDDLNKTAQRIAEESSVMVYLLNATLINDDNATVSSHLISKKSARIPQLFTFHPSSRTLPPIFWEALPRYFRTRRYPRSRLAPVWIQLGSMNGETGFSQCCYDRVWSEIRVTGVDAGGSGEKIWI